MVCIKKFVTVNYNNDENGARLLCRRKDKVSAVGCFVCLSYVEKKEYSCFLHRCKFLYLNICELFNYLFKC